MEKARFWELISATRLKANGNMDKHVNNLREELLKLEPEEIIDFERHLRDCMDRAYNWDLWGAAYIIGGGCSDDNFIDFRSWLISMGKDIFESALKDTETLSDVVDRPDIEDCFFEEFLYVPGKVYEEKLGSEMPFLDRGISSEPQGRAWEEDEELQERFPKLWKKFEDE